MLRRHPSSVKMCDLHLVEEKNLRIFENVEVLGLVSSLSIFLWAKLYFDVHDCVIGL